MIAIDPWSPDPTRPYLNLEPIVDFLRRKGNPPAGDGFTEYIDAWVCRMESSLDFDAIVQRFTMPPSVRLSRGRDTILDENSWVAIQGPGAHSAPTD